MTPISKAAAVALIAVAVGFTHWRITAVVRDVDALASVPKLIADEGRLAKAAIEASRNEALIEHEQLLRSRLEQAASGVSDVEAKKLEDRLRPLLVEISASEERIKSLREESARAVSGLPEQVELDELNQYYTELFSRNAANSFTSIESFTTSVGQINFQKQHFAFLYLADSGELVSMRLGKEASTENSELIRAWVEEATRAKVRFGYSKVHERKRPSDYGEYTEALYRKGDMYFRTFVQHQRVQGTYGRHSLEYTYYVEIGSTARSERFQLEQYNKKLGS